MLEIPQDIAVVMNGIAQCVILFGGISSVGLFAAWPILRVAWRNGIVVRFCIIDIASLFVIITLLFCCVVTVYDSPDDIVVFVSATLVLLFWWTIVAGALSQIGDGDGIRRIAYQLFVVPAAFLGPSVVVTLLAQLVNSSIGLRNIEVIVFCLVAIGYVGAFYFSAVLANRFKTRAESGGDMGQLSKSEKGDKSNKW